MTLSAVIIQDVVLVGRHQLLVFVQKTAVLLIGLTTHRRFDAGQADHHQFAIYPDPLFGLELARRIAARCLRWHCKNKNNQCCKVLYHSYINTQKRPKQQMSLAVLTLH